jgi:UDP-glucose 4-epimerase
VETLDGSSTALKRVEKITGKPVTFYKCDLLDGERLAKIFQQVKPINRILRQIILIAESDWLINEFLHKYSTRSTV